MKFNAWKHGFKIKEVPIIFTDRTRGQSKMSSGIFKEAVFGVLEMKIKSLFKKYQPAYSIEANGTHNASSYLRSSVSIPFLIWARNAGMPRV